MNRDNCTPLEIQLMDKVSDLAKELSVYEERFMHYNLSSSGHSKSGDTARRNSFSETAQKKRIDKAHTQQLEALQKQLDVAELRLSEHIKTKKKLIADLDIKVREASFLEKQCSDLQRENQQLKSQIESTVRIASMATKTNPRGVRTTNHNNNATSAPHNITHQEFLELKRTLEVSQAETVRYREKEQMLRMRTKVLEDALEFRSDEIGLSGHADLLTQVARLRGEVTALRNDLNEKAERLVRAEDQGSEVLSQRDQLQRQVTKIQQRLAQTQQETHRLQSGDLGAKLKAAEADRERYDELYQSATQKLSALARENDALRSEVSSVRAKITTTEQRQQESSERISSASDTIGALEAQLHEESARSKQLVQANEILQAEKESVSRQLERKSLEADELGQLQANQYLQLRSREEELHAKNETIATLRLQLQEAEQSLPALQSDNKALRQRLSFAENEATSMRDSLSTLEPRLTRIEPEFNRLKADWEQWRQEKLDLSSELTKLRPVAKLLADLTRDLQEQPNEGSQEEPQLFDSLTKPLGASSTSNNHITQHSNNNPYALSHHHAAWIGFSSIRNLHPGLYDRIRSLARDLYQKEVQCRELQSVVTSAQHETQRLERENNSNLLHLTRAQDSHLATVNELNERIRVAEEEAATHRTARITLDQIRVMLRSYPGNLADLYPNTSPTKYGAPRGEIGTATRTEQIEQFLSNVPDALLPDLLGRALQFNAAAVASCSESNAKFCKLRAEHDDLLSKHALLTRERNDLERSLFDAQERLHAAQDKLNNSSSDTREQLQKASALAEHQNALTITYQAQVEKVQRELQIKKASIMALRHKEEVVAQRLFTALADYSARLGVSAPDDASDVQELLRHVEDVLRTTATVHSHQPGRSSRQHAQDYSSSNYNNNNDFVSPLKYSSAEPRQRSSAHKRQEVNQTNEFGNSGLVHGEQLCQSHITSNRASRNSSYKDSGSHNQNQNRGSPPTAKSGARGSSRSPPAETDRRVSRSQQQTRVRSHSENSPRVKSRGPTAAEAKLLRASQNLASLYEY